MVKNEVYHYTGGIGVAALQVVYNAYDPLLNLYFPCIKQVSCERIGAKKKRRYDKAKTPLLRLLACSFEDKLDELRVKHNALTLKDSCALVEQKGLIDKAVDCLIRMAHDVPVIPRIGSKPHG
ncbi:MAG: hypothetical protein Pg6A_01630 [Termitinemataceae bacterium]|nr:MAG: hypothetical protein Pg6A_01630 [Termitinemataceae bacterium]